MHRFHKWISYRIFLECLFLVLAVFVVYANVYENAFLYDDEFLILRNEAIRSLSGLWTIFTLSSTGGAGSVDNFYRPMQGFLYLIVYGLGGESLFGFHFLNILLHALNAVLVFGLGLKLGLDRRACFFAALIWCVHPVHTEAVTYMSATADPLYALFVMLSLVIGLPDFRGWRVLGSCLCFVLALMSKESAIVTPALAMVCLWLIAPRRWNWRSYLRTIPLWVVAALYMIARSTILDFNRTFDFYQKPNFYTENIWYRIFTALATLPEYKSLLIWPAELHIDRTFPVFVSFLTLPVVLGFAMILTGLLWAVWSYRRGRLGLPWGFAWFGAAHAPHTGILVAVNALVLEHWMYLPSVGLFLGASASLVPRLKSPSTRYLTGFLFAAAVIALGTRTWQQNKMWADPVSFYSHIIHFSPDVPRVHNNLGMALADLGRFDEAIHEYKETIRLSAGLPQPYHNLAQLYFSRGDVHEAQEYYEKALEQDPHFFYSAFALSEIWRSRGNMEFADKYRKQGESSRGILRR